MSMRVIWGLVLSLVAGSAVADEFLWEKLRRDPNMIVLMRNSESSGNQDGANMFIWDASGECQGESNLTAKGKAQAKRIGKAFAERGVRPTVISSPMCRCRETAELAFGRHFTHPDLRLQSATGEVFQERATALLRQHRGRKPVVFVNHRPNINSLTMELINIGELLVGSINEDGEIEVLGKIRGDP